MRAAVLVEQGRIEMEQRPVPTPQPGDVLIRVSSVGVCGSDTHYYRHGRVGGFVVEAPLVLGHEAAGTIVGVGESVDPSRIGQRVSIEPQRPDPDSDETRRGHYNLCPHMQFFATPPVDGALCDYVTIGAEFAHPVPDSMSDDAAALCEPLSVGIAAIRKAELDGRSRVLDRGRRTHRHRGDPARPGLWRDGDRRQRSGPGPSRPRHRVRRHHRSLDPTVESGPTISRSTRSSTRPVPPRPSPPASARCGRRARVVLVGSGAETMELPTQLIQNRELVLTGVFRYANTWPTAIALVESGRVDLDAMVTARFPLEKAAEALDSDRTPGSVKSVVTVS